MPNDAVSSLYVPSQLYVELFKNDNFDTSIGKLQWSKTVNYGFLLINYHL